jgi:dCMP deaminase
MPLDKWDGRFLEVAKLASEWSKEVGAVIVDAQRQIAAVGYNGFPISVEDSAERLGDKETKNEMIVYAEENTVLAAGIRAKGGTIYVVGKPVCPRCAGTIIQSRIKRVVASTPKEGTDSHWDKVGKIALEMMTEAKIEFVPTSN